MMSNPPSEKNQPNQNKVYGFDLTFDGNNPPTEYPSVSLCMIVKNEEENLADCLASVGDFAGEVIVVDTGSTDRTVEIAQALGARVEHFTWIDDFAAARNESIKYATGDYIFWMDADDRLELDGPAKLKQAMASGQSEVYMCRVVSGSASGEKTEAIVEHLRLFPNHRGLQFRNVLHESIMEAAQEQKLRIARTNIVVNHTGYDISPEEYRQKARRNLGIVNAKLAQKPGDLYWRYHRACSLIILNELESTIEDYEAVIADPPATLNWDVYVYQAHTALIHLYFDRNQEEDVLRVLHLALERFPNRRHLAVLEGMIHMHYDALDKALAALQRARQLSPITDLVGQKWPPGKLERTLGQVYLLLGKPRFAADTFRAMLAQKGVPVHDELPEVWAQAQKLVEQESYAEAFAMLEMVADGNPTVLRRLGEIEDKRGNWRTAPACLAQAMALDGVRPGDWVTLATYVLHTRHFETVRRLCRLALADNEEDADALNMLGFVAMQQNQPEEAMEYILQALFTQPNQEWATKNLADLAAMLGLTVPQAVTQYGAMMLQRRQYSRAVTPYVYLVQLTPTNPQPYKSLAVALNGLNRTAEATQAWETAQFLESGR
jgi:glycosyltransferase involved in cell wall biosynthesis/Flp pilus assembly protein TadD